MKIKIIKDNNPIMRKRSSEVELPLSNEDRDILDSMLDYLKKSQDDEYAKKHNIRAGVGLAAIQIGILKRMFVIYVPMGEEIVQYQVVNPKIIETSIRLAALSSGEGCLSVDNDHPGYVHRNYRIKMKFFDALTNEEVILTARGYLAIVLQHEYDHLDGKFYYDRIDKNKPTAIKMNEEII
jgi:peptide deformylase